jgi:hypothetical protein
VPHDWRGELAELPITEGRQQVMIQERPVEGTAA